FRSLSMENEGWDVARALNRHGVAAFVLKYRLNQTPADLDGFAESIRQMLSGPRPPRDPGAADAAKMLEPQLADARAAFALVRSRAAEWNIDPDRIGMIGFSAGAMLTLTTALHGEDARPAFIGNIYGPISAVNDVPADAPPMLVAPRAAGWNPHPDPRGRVGCSPGPMRTLTTALPGEDARPAFIGNAYGPISAVNDVPADAPPMFVALAADDGLFSNQGFGIVESWQKAGRPVEFHYYEQGGHGFGMYQKETTSTGWFDAWVSWL